MPSFIFVEFFLCFIVLEFYHTLILKHTAILFLHLYTFKIFHSSNEVEKKCINFNFLFCFFRSNQSIKKMKEVPYSMHVGGKNPIVYRVMWLLKNEKKIEILMVLVLPAIVAPIFR